MVSILKNQFTKFKDKINTKISSTKEGISNLVLAALLTTGVGMVTKAQANVEHLGTNDSIHKVKKGDGLLKIAKKYGISINKLIDLNKGRKYGNHSIIGKKSTIYLGSNLIISNQTKYINKKIGNTKETKSISRISKKIQIKEKEIKLEKKETRKIQEYIKIKLNPATRYSAMYMKKGNKYKKQYTISPSDTPIFSGKIKKLNGKIYIEIILENDKNITGFININTFDKESKLLIKDTLKNKKNINKTKLKPKEIYSNKNTVQVNKKLTIDKAIYNTLKYASSKTNAIGIKDIQALQLLSIQLNKTKSIIEKLNNKSNSRIYLIHKIDTLSEGLNIKKIPVDLKNDSIEKVFDYYATLERLLQTKNYFSVISFDEIYTNYIKKDFGGNWTMGLKTISKKLLLSENIIGNNSELKNELIELRNKGINTLLQTISKAENTNNNYNAIFNNGKQSKIKYTEMTVEDVLKDMRKRIKTKGFSATGKYQFLYLTLKDLSKKYNIDIKNQLFSERFQEKIARIKLKERGLRDFIQGKLKRDDFQINLSIEWASLAKDHSNKSFHEDDGINKAFCSNETIDLILDNIKNPKPQNKSYVASL